MNRAYQDSSVQRIYAMCLRYLYLLRSSWPRIVELAYWPTVQMILWGLISQFFAENSTWLAQAAGILIGAVLLWDVVFRGQLGVSLVFFEELHARNLAHLFVSPLRPIELIASLLLISFVRTVIGVGVAALLAIVMYHYSIFDLGLPLLAFFTNLLVMGWAMGLIVAALVLRFGVGAESLAWVVVFAVAPLSGIFYPIEILPQWAQTLAWWLPASHVFEGLRAVMLENQFPLNLFYTASLLNLVYLLVSIAVFLHVFSVARRDGLLMRIGE
ncbi:MAG: ABC transporter permease [Gammaproteobacteria bacterium]|nr:ABC transporter permease [Gammaproteobacteria bacterium]